MADPMNTEQLAELAAPVHAYLELRAAELAAPAIEQAERESAYYERALPDLKSEFRRQWNSSEKRMAVVTQERDDARAEIKKLREELSIARDAFEIPQHEAVKAQAELEQLRAHMVTVNEFLAERAQFVRTLRQCVGGNADYHRWQGHAEARRVLSQMLGLPAVWPDEDGPKMADHNKMMELVAQLSPETRTRIAQRLDDRFHELTDNEEPSLDPSEAKRRQRENEAVERWNNHHPVGAPVRYWPGAREGAGVESVTRTPAQMLGGHSAVVWMEGYSSCIFLTHVEAITEQDGGAA